jgi:hypothetical protein
MPLTTPMSFREALAYLIRKKALPTSATSAEIAQWDAALRDSSLFSAQTLMEGYLEDIRTAVLSTIDPQRVRREDRVTPDNPEGFVTEGMNDAQAREFLREKLKGYGYSPDPEKRGTIQDLSSNQRIDLVVQMNKRMAQSEGQKRQRQEPTILHAYPGWELFRAESRKERRNWHEIAKAAAAQTGSKIVLVGTEGVIALKNDPVWVAMSDFGREGSPVKWGSGMEFKDVHQRRMIELGFDLPTIQPQTGIKLREAA